MNPNTLNSSNSPSNSASNHSPQANSAPASQADTRATTKPIDCSNPQDQQEMNQCAVQGYEAADQELQTLYQQMQSQMSDPARSQLVTAEEEWVEFRAAQCRLEAKPNEGGSLYPTKLYRCMERLTRDRIKQLQQQVQSEV